MKTLILFLTFTLLSCVKEEIYVSTKPFPTQHGYIMTGGIRVHLLLYSPEYEGGTIEIRRNDIGSFTVDEPVGQLVYTATDVQIHPNITGAGWLSQIDEDIAISLYYKYGSMYQVLIKSSDGLNYDVTWIDLSEYLDISEFYVIL